MTGVDALFARAIALEDSDRPDEALEHYRQLLAQAPRHADAWHNRGLLLAKLGRFEEAELNYRRCLEAAPDSLRARNGLADVLLALGRYDGAIEALGGVLQRAPDDASALVRRGVALACLRRFAEARETFAFARNRYPEEVARFVQRVAPGSGSDAALSPENIFLSRRYMLLGQCDWSGWNDFVAEMRKAASAPHIVLEPAVGFMMQHLPLDGDERHAIARHIAAGVEAVAPALPAPAPRQRSRVRIGILSADFREHLNSYLLLPLFELLDRKRFELFAYSLVPDDGSAARARICAAADHFRELHEMADQEAALAIRSDDIDLLVDAAGHTTGGRFGIVARRPARVQALYLGYSCSLGSGRVDYAIVDRTAAPSGDEWSEALAYVPQPYFLYDYRVPAPQGPVSRRDYGLPENVFVYCAFHRPEKVTPDVFSLWMEILARVPRSVLWLLAMPVAAMRNLRTEAAAHGIDSSRLVFAPFEPRHGDRYLPRQRLGDLMLDSLHHNAMTTACDALGAGLPVLTLQGPAIAARVGASLLHAAGLPELITTDRKAFADTAVRLADEPALLREYKDRLARNRSTAPLFDTAGRVRELEVAFEQMLARHHENQPCDE